VEKKYNKNILESVVNRTAGLTVDLFNRALERHEITGDVDKDSLVDFAHEHGLEAGEIDQALQEVSEQLDIEASSVARHEHESKRKETKLFDVRNQVSLRWHSMLETFGKGKIAERAEKQRHDRLQNNDYIAGLIEAALERASIRRRFKQYSEIGGNNFVGLLKQYQKNEITRADLERQADFNDGVDVIVERLDIPQPFKIDGVAIEMTPQNEKMIKNHLRFVLQAEVIQLAQLGEMKVMETGAYHVTDKRNARTWATVASKVLGSGTLWGIGVRGVGRMAIGGSIVGASLASNPVGWGVIGAAIGTGAVAGAASQWAQYKFVRRQQRKMDLATGMTREQVGGLEVTKSAQEINTHLLNLVREIKTLTQAMTREKSSELMGKVQDLYQIIIETDCRLLQSQIGGQDLVSFGLENRLQASLDLLENLKEATLVVRDTQAKHLPNIDLSHIAHDAKQVVDTIQRNLESALSRGEGKRMLLGGVLGGTMAGISATAMDYISSWLTVHHVNVPVETPPPVEQPPTLVANLNPNLPDTITFQGHQVSLLMDNDGNMAIYNTDSGAVDLTHPLTDPIDTTPYAADHQLHVDTQPNGNIIILTEHNEPVAIYDIDVDATTTVSHEIDPNSEAGRLLAQISDPAYIEQTESWRQQRLDLLMEAYSSGRLSSNESSELVAARLERATRHMLMETTTYHGNKDQALNEAFSEDVTVIQHQDLPWIKGPSSHVARRWIDVVTALRKVEPTEQTVETLKVKLIDQTPPPQPVVPQPPVVTEQTNQAIIKATQAAAALAGLALDQYIAPVRSHGGQPAPHEAPLNRLEEFKFVPAKEAPEEVAPTVVVAPPRVIIPPLPRPEPPKPAPAPEEASTVEPSDEEVQRKESAELENTIKYPDLAAYIVEEVHKQIPADDRSVAIDLLVADWNDKFPSGMGGLSNGAIEQTLGITLGNIPTIINGIVSRMKAAVRDPAKVSDIIHIVDRSKLDELDELMAPPDTKPKPPTPTLVPIPQPEEVIADQVVLPEPIPVVLPPAAEVAATELAATVVVPTEAKPTPASAEEIDKQRNILESVFKSKELAGVIVDGIKHLPAASFTQAVKALNGNWLRLKHAEPFLAHLDEIETLQVLGLDPLEVKISATGLIANIISNAPNIITLVDTPKRLEWKITDKSKKIKEKFGDKFRTGLQNYVIEQSLYGVRVVEILAAFNQQTQNWKGTRPELLKKLGCFDEAGTYDESKAEVVFGKIVRGESIE
jgi:hypothetical protein